MGSSTLKIAGLFLFLVLVISLTTFGLFSSTKTATGGLSESEIRQIVKEEIKSNPELILNSVTDYQRNSQARQNEDAKQVIATNKEWLENDPTSPIAGNPDADVTVVEFFDYSCGYCKRALPDIVKLLESDKNVKVAFKEFPILGPNSALAAKAALAINLVAPDKYMDFHKEAMSKRLGGKDSILGVVTTLGLDAAVIEEKMESDEVNEIIAKNRQLADIAGIRGTPAFVINGELIPGAMDYDDMVAKIKAARADIK